MKNAAKATCAAALAGLCAALCPQAEAFTVECLPMYGVFYPGLANQPCIRIKVNATAGEKIKVLKFAAGKNTHAENITKVRLSQTGGNFSFTPNAIARNQPTTLGAATLSANGTVTFKPKKPIELQQGDNYFWISCDISPSAKGGSEIGFKCTSLTDGNGEKVKPEKELNGLQGKAGRVHHFKHRIGPYYRARFLAKENGHGLLDASHFKLATDFILFGVSYNGTNIGYYGCNAEEYRRALEIAKEFREGTDCLLIAGFALSESSKGSGNRNTFGGIISDPPRRRELARNLASFVKDNGFDGLDLDYEYPRQSNFGSWDAFANFLTDLREELAGTGATLSIAVTVRYDAPSPRVYDQVDYINLMSYGAPGEHATMALVTSDVAWAKKAKIPNVKIMVGLPYFSRDTQPKHQDGGGLLYTAILNQHPNLSSGANTFTNTKDGKKHYFNGQDLIKQKCRYVVSNKLGGVIIWAYEGDAKLTDHRSLSKALYSVIKQTKR